MSPGRSRKPISPVAKIYLLLYNAAQFLGWLWTFHLMIQHFINNGLTNDSLWDKVKHWLAIFQTSAVLEIVHSAVGIVPSGVFVTLPQVFSRVFVLWPILFEVSEANQSWGFPLLLAAWTVTEVMRYLYYALSLISVNLWILQWCRYSFFIILYPVGITGELLCCYRALPYYDSTQRYSILLPNKWNTTFSFYYYTVLIMLAYIPVFPQLYGHMFAQRKKILGAQKKD